MNAKTYDYYKSINLEALSLAEYSSIKEAGMLYEIYPEATGVYNNDVLNMDKANTPSRIDNIGQNGNDGGHYEYRVPMSDNPEAVDWIEDIYGVKKDDLFLDDYVPDILNDLKNKAYDPEEFYSDPVSPSHYEIGNLGLEAIDVIEATLSKEEYIGYLRGNILKYQLRASKKNGNEDLAKADVYSGWLVIATEGE